MVDRTMDPEPAVLYCPVQSGSFCPRIRHFPPFCELSWEAMMRRLPYLDATGCLEPNPSHSNSLKRLSTVPAASERTQHSYVCGFNYEWCPPLHD